MSVSVYIRERGTRRYIPANPKLQYPAGTTYVLRNTDADGKRLWETLRDVGNVSYALMKAKRQS